MTITLLQIGTSGLFAVFVFYHLTKMARREAEVNETLLNAERVMNEYNERNEQ